jgi:hypothetical protein
MRESPRRNLVDTRSSSAYAESLLAQLLVPEVWKEILSVERKRVPWKDVDFVGDLTAIHSELKALPNVAGWGVQSVRHDGPWVCIRTHPRNTLRKQLRFAFSCFPLQIVWSHHSYLQSLPFEYATLLTVMNLLALFWCWYSSISTQQGWKAFLISLQFSSSMVALKQQWVAQYESRSPSRLECMGIGQR